MIYLLITALLFGALFAYFPVANRYNIIDKPNQRSSHTAITIRGGGIIFPVAMLLYFLFFGMHAVPVTTNVCMLAGTLAISLVSFWDDVSSLPKGQYYAGMGRSSGRTDHFSFLKL